MKILTESVARIQAQIRAQFSAHNIFYQQDGYGTRMTIQGATCRHLKNALRGIVHQNQKQFCRDIEAFGFIMNWSDTSQAWIVHDSVITGNETKYQYDSQKALKSRKGGR